MQQPTPYMPAAPAPKKTNWLLIGVIAAVGLCCCLVVLGVVMFTVFSPNIVIWSMTTLCPSQYGMTTAECEQWSEDLQENHYDEYLSCFTPEEGGSGTVDEVFACLERKGIGPGDIP